MLPLSQKKSTTDGLLITETCAAYIKGMVCASAAEPSHIPVSGSTPWVLPGIPMPHVTVAAFDLVTGEEKRYGERGEIRVLTPCRMLGYYKKPVETAKYFHSDAHGNVWACTGDMGYVAEDGNVYVSGRISDSYVTSNGRTVYLFDIERAVLDIPQVRQCKAIPHEINGVMTHICHTALIGGANLEETLRMIKKHALKSWKVPISQSCSDFMTTHCPLRPAVN